MSAPTTRSSPRKLSTAIYTNGLATTFRFRQEVNFTSGAEAYHRLGGNGKSGNDSRQSGVWVLDQFIRWQSMNWDFSGALQKTQMDVTTIEPGLNFTG